MVSEVKMPKAKAKKVRKSRKERRSESSGGGGGDWFDVLELISLPFRAIWWIITHLLDIILFPFKLIGAIFEGFDGL